MVVATVTVVLVPVADGTKLLAEKLHVVPDGNPPHTRVIGLLNPEKDFEVTVTAAELPTFVAGLRLPDEMEKSCTETVAVALLTAPLSAAVKVMVLIPGGVTPGVVETVTAD